MFQGCEMLKAFKEASKSSTRNICTAYQKSDSGKLNWGYAEKRNLILFKPVRYLKPSQSFQMSLSVTSRCLKFDYK